MNQEYEHPTRPFATNIASVRWRPNTCDCVIIVDHNDNLLHWQQKCKLHEPLPDVSLGVAVFAHNRSFNLRRNLVMPQDFAIENEGLSNRALRARAIKEGRNDVVIVLDNLILTKQEMVNEKERIRNL